MPCAASPCVSAGAMSKRLVAFREAAIFQGTFAAVARRWLELISMVFKSVVGLMLTSFMGTWDTLRVAQTGLYVGPLNLLVDVNDEAEGSVQNDVDV